MTAQKGSDVLLKVGDGGTPEAFATVGGLRGTDFSLTRHPIDVTNMSSAGFQELLDCGGTQSISISGDGLFTDIASETLIRSYAFSGEIRNYELEFGNGDKISGAFQITNYERSGDVEDEERYAISLLSSGQFIYIPV